MSPLPTVASIAPAAAAQIDPATAPLSALSKQFLSDLAATHHRAEFADCRDKQREYVQELQRKLAEEEEEALVAQRDGGEAAVEALRQERAALCAKPAPPPSPTEQRRRDVVDAKRRVAARLRDLGVACSDPDDFLAIAASEGSITLPPRPPPDERAAAV